jgi:hypothetical protein
MKQRILFLAFFSFVFNVYCIAQQNRFIYIQTENKQPFYVKVKSAVLSSSSTGYVVIPKLKDETYQLTFGFPQNEWPQQTISCTVNKKDAGYVLKNFGNKGWGLFNLQTLEVLMAKSSEAAPSQPVEVNNDVFSQVLSDVVNTPDLGRKTVVKETKPISVAETKVAEPVRAEPLAQTPVTEIRPSVKLLLNYKNENGREMTFIDNAGAQPDTIRIFIPAGEATAAVVKKDKPAVKQQVKNTETAKNIPVQTAPEKFIEMELANPNSREDTPKVPGETAAVKEKTVPAITMVNSDCKANATNDDFLKLRKKMAAENNEDDMVAVARKAFRSRCYSTENIKNLSVLFLNDAGRYKFFDAAYPFVYDSGNFSGLQQQLTDPYFITRFQAMIRR